MPELPDSIAKEIAAKRTDDSSVTNPEEKQEENKPTETPKEESKKSEVARPKAGQSIAQVAMATEDEGDDDEEDDEDGEKPTRKNGIPFSEFMKVKKQLREQKNANKETAATNLQLAKAVESLMDRMDAFSKSKSDMRDEIEEYAEQWGLDPKGARQLVDMIEKRVSAKNAPKKAAKQSVDEDDEDDEDDAPKKKVAKKPQFSARQIELAIENEHEDFLKSYPQVKDKVNLKVIKQFIMSDEKNLTKKFEDVVLEIYPNVLQGRAALDGKPKVNDGGEGGEEYDWNDPKTQERVQKDPKVRKAYNDDLLARYKTMYK